MRKRITIRTLKKELRKTQSLERKLKSETKKLQRNLKQLKSLMKKKGYRV